MKIVVADTATIQTRVGTLLEKELLPIIDRKDLAILGLPGGRSILPVIEIMPSLAIPWDKVCVFFVDERWLPKDDPERNETVVTQAIGAAFGPKNGPRVVPAPGPDSNMSPSAGATAYGDELKAMAAGRINLDVAILGIGEDGHIASIFPGHPLSLEDDPAYVSVEESPKPPPTRVTVNPSLVTSVSCVIGLLFGDQKADAYRRLTSGESATSLPAALIREATRGYVFADYAAAGGAIATETT